MNTAPGNIPMHDFSTDDARSIRFRLLPLEEKEDHDVSVPHRHNYYEIFLFEKGGGMHTIDFADHAIQTGSLHFVSPGQVHQVQRQAGSFGTVIFFSRDFMLTDNTNKHFLFELPFLNGNSTQPILQLSRDQLNGLQPLVQALKAETSRATGLNEEIVRSYLKIFLLTCLRLYSENSPGSDAMATTGLMKDFRIAVEHFFRQWHQVQDYAAHLNTSAKNLNEHCKRATGKTAGEFIADRVTLEARRLLLHSDLSVKEIAYFLSYQDPAHFSNFFKANTGQSPTEFRQQV